MPDTAAKGFWDDRAREAALYFVDNRVRYRDPDEERFWAEGVHALTGLLTPLGVEIGPDERIVDIGCGVGRLTRNIAVRARDVRAIDVSPEMIRRARELNAHLDNVEWIEGDGTSLAGIDDASADGVVSFVVFQHIPDPQITYGYLHEIGRVLRPGGWAAFHVSNDPRIHRQRPPVADRLRALVGRAPRGQTHPNWQGSSVDLAELRQAAEAGGMTVEQVVGEGTQFCLVRTARR